MRLFSELSNPHGNVLMVSPLVFDAPKNISNEDFEEFVDRLKSLLKFYLKARGLSGSDEELGSLLEPSLTEGLFSIQRGLSRLGYYGIQHALKHPEEHCLEES